MSNTFSSSLVVDTATKQTITVLQAKLAALKNFATDFSSDVVDPLRKLQVGVATSANAVVSSPTSFESSGTTLTNSPVTMTHYSSQFQLSSQQINQGFRLEQIMKVQLRALANAIMDAALAPINTTTFGAPTYSSAITVASGGVLGNSLITTALPALWAALENGTEKHLILDGSYYSYLLPQSGFSIDQDAKGAYGFDSVSYNNRWNGITGGSDSNLNGTTHTIKGFVASPEALAMAAAIPYVDPSVQNLLEVSEVIEVPDLGININFNVWGSLASRSLSASFDVAFGSAAADGSALKTIVL